MPVTEEEQVARLQRYQNQFPRETRKIFDNFQTALVDKMSEIFIAPDGTLRSIDCFGKNLVKFHCKTETINHQNQESENK